MATHAGARISAIGVVVICVTVFLPWFSYLAGFFYSSGSTSSYGWDILTEPLAYSFYGVRSSPIFCGTGLLTLIVEGLVGYVLLANVTAASQPDIPRPKWWHIGVLAFPIISLLVALVFTGFYVTEIGYWLNLAGFILVYVGNLFQIRIARQA
jgi:hypothetical protein